jgi:hypothetical protein
MSNDKQTTAVKLLVEKLRETIGNSIISVMEDEIAEAEAMFRQQIEDAVDDALRDANLLYEKYQKIKSGEQYFNETFTQ